MSDFCALTNNVVGSANLCSGEVEYDDYGFAVSKGAAWFFTIAFGISMVLHIGQAIRFRTWSLLWTAAACGLAEMLGWIARLASALTAEWTAQFGGLYIIPNDSWYLMQISTLIIAPAFLAAACYIILGWIIQELGPEHSILRPRTYIWLFVSGDVLSLVIQAVGGGMAASADTQSGADNGAWIMFAGIIWQIFVMIGFFVVITMFMFRLWKNPYGEPIELKSKLLLASIYASMLFVFIRCAYRVAELSQGWNSDIIHDQGLFNGLDGVMMIIALYLINIFHPGYLLNTRSRPISTRSEKMEMQATA